MRACEGEESWNYISYLSVTGVRSSFINNQLVMKRDIGREDRKKQTKKSKHWLLHQRAGAGETTNRDVQRLKCCSKCTCKIPLAGSDEKARCHQLC